MTETSSPPPVDTEHLYRLKAARLSPQYEYKNEKLLIVSDGALTLYIPGTDDLRDLHQDFRIREAHWDYPEEFPAGWPVHSGFRDSAHNILKMFFTSYEYKEYISIGDRVRVVGHSKGGAAGILVGIALHQMGFNASVLTYGAPQVTPERREFDFELMQIVATGDPIAGIIPWEPLVEPRIVGSEHVLRPPILNHVVDHYIRVISAIE